MKLKHKPTQPIRKTDIEEDLSSWYIDDKIDISLIESDIRAHVINNFGQYFKALGITINDYKRFYLKCDNNYYEGLDIRVVGVRDESNKEFQERLNKYNKAITKYNAWYAKNKSQIEQELEKRKIDKEVRKQQEKDRIREQIQRLQKKL